MMLAATVTVTLMATAYYPTQVIVKLVAAWHGLALIMTVASATLGAPQHETASDIAAIKMQAHALGMHLTACRLRG